MQSRAVMMRTLTVIAAVLVTLSSQGAVAQRRVAPSDPTTIKLSFAPIVKKAAPAVVNVFARGRVQVPQSPFMDDPFFRRFFGNRGGLTQERMQSSLGSGVIVHPSGIIVTNTHVVKVGGSAEIKVVLSDKREFDARVVVQDDKADIAILKVDGLKGDGSDGAFAFLEFEDSDAIEVGDLVLAIGNPFGVGQTVTQGIVSALGRSEIGKSDAEIFIQTDAAINPGNSGGALVDMSGRLVGINTAIYSSTGSSHGIGFAIPSNLVKLYVDSALTGRKVVRPWIGAKFEAVSREIAEALGLQRASGAVVVRVTRDGPAAKAGLVAGDIVREVDGTEVGDARALLYRLTTRGIGNQSQLQVMRRGQPLAVTLSLRAAPEPGRDDVRNLSGNHPLDGARVGNIGPWLSDEMGIDDEKGVVILSVRQGSIAANLGFAAGDVVLNIRDTAVQSVVQLETLVQARAPLWQVEFRRDGRVRQLQIRG